MQSTFTSSSPPPSTLKQKRKSLSTPSSPTSPTAKVSRPTLALPTRFAFGAPPPQSFDCDMDTDDAVSGGSTSADESQPPTPASASFSNPRQGGQQYPFGTVPTGGPGLPGGDALPTWAVPEETKGNFGLLGAAGRAGHGPGCTTIPRVILGEPNALTGKRSLWSVCSNCGAAAIEDCSKW